MMKFFRKYMKHLLVFFMAALLVIWLAGDALTNLLMRDRGLDSSPRAVMFGEQVTLVDMQPAFQEANILERLGLNWRYVWGRSLALVVGADMNALQQYAMQVRMEPITEEEWYMLDTEARRSGPVVPREAVDRFKAEVQLSGEALARVRDQFGISLDRIDQAIQSMVRITEMVDMANHAVKPSEADVRAFVRQSQEKVRINALVVDATKFLDTAYEPTEEELIAQFEEGKDQDPSPWSGGEFGYRQPEKVATEYIRVSVEALAGQQEIPRDDDLYEYWQARREEFLRPATQPATTPAGTPPAPEEPKPYETFSEAKPKVIERLREERAKAEALRIGRDLIAQLGRPWSTVAATQPGGYKTPPQSETRAEVYTDLLAGYDRRFTGALSRGEIALMDARELASNQELGQAMAFRGTQRPVSFGQAAFYVSGLEAQREDNLDHARLFRSLYETCPEPFVDAAGDVFVFRTTVAQPKQPPASWQEVREQLVADVRNRRAHAEAGRHAAALQEKAAEGGLKAAFEAEADLLTKLGQEAFKQPAPFSRMRSMAFGGQVRVMPNFIPGVGGGPELMDLCFGLAEAVATQPADRVRVHEEPNRRQWVVIEWVETLPVTQAEYDTERVNAFNHILVERRVDFLRNWFDSQEMRRRVGWEEIKPPAPAEQPDLPAEQTPEA